MHIVAKAGSDTLSHHLIQDLSWRDKEPLSEEEFLLNDRLEKIRSIVHKYGKDNFYISFSGGRDSCVLSALTQMALGDEDDIPRVYADTGIELNMVRDFVISLAEKDRRFQIIKPVASIKETLETEGYPFKSKSHSKIVDRYQRIGMADSVRSYLAGDWGPVYTCPKSLQYQFTEDFKLRVSDRCCYRLKEEPLQKWGEEHGRPYTMIGIMPDEGGRRTRAKCLAFSEGKMRFQPLVVLDKAWEDWFIDKYDIAICDIYKPPYSLKRTGCKSCPFSLNLEAELKMLETYFPAEYRQCHMIFGPVFAEYRRIGFRLKSA